MKAKGATEPPPPSEVVGVGGWAGSSGKYAITRRPLINPAALTVTGHAGTQYRRHHGLIYTLSALLQAPPDTPVGLPHTTERQSRSRNRVTFSHLIQIQPYPTQALSLAPSPIRPSLVQAKMVNFMKILIQFPLSCTLYRANVIVRPRDALWFCFSGFLSPLFLFSPLPRQ